MDEHVSVGDGMQESDAEAQIQQPAQPAETPGQAYAQTAGEAFRPAASGPPVFEDDEEAEL